MRTTFDLPEDLYRRLKARAALSGVSMRAMMQRFVEDGLASWSEDAGRLPERREPPPVIVAPRGVPIPALTRADLRRIEEADDEAKHARFA